MSRAEVIARLKSAEPDLRARGVAGLYLFGSYSRGEQRPDSDIDLFIDKQPGRRFGFSELTGSYRLLQHVLPDIPSPTGRFPDTDWPGIVALGNILRHEYQTVDPDTIFEMLSEKVPELAAVVDQLIRELEE